MCHVPTTPWQHLCCSIRSPQCLLQALTSTRVEKGGKTLEDYEPLTKHREKQLHASQNGDLLTADKKLLESLSLWPFPCYPSLRAAYARLTRALRKKSLPESILKKEGLNKHAFQSLVDHY